MIGSFYSYRNWITPSLHQSKMEYCFHIWDGTVQSELASFDTVQKHFNLLVMNNFPTVFHTRYVTSLSLLYLSFHVSCSGELHSLVSQVKNFQARTRHSPLGLILWHCLRIPSHPLRPLLNRTSRMVTRSLEY